MALATVKISALPSGSPATPADLLEIVQSGSNKQIPLSAIPGAFKGTVVLADAATVTPNADTTSLGTLTSTQAFTLANPTGTPIDGQRLLVRVKTASARAITWGNQYRGGTNAALPATTTGGGKTDYFGFIYNAADTKWDFFPSLGY